MKLCNLKSELKYITGPKSNDIFPYTGKFICIWIVIIVRFHYGELYYNIE